MEQIDKVSGSRCGSSAAWRSRPSPPLHTLYPAERRGENQKHTKKHNKTRTKSDAAASALWTLAFTFQAPHRRHCYRWQWLGLYAAWEEGFQNLGPIFLILVIISSCYNSIALTNAVLGTWWRWYNGPRNVSSQTITTLYLEIKPKWAHLKFLFPGHNRSKLNQEVARIFHIIPFLGVTISFRIHSWFK